MRAFLTLLLCLLASSAFAAVSEWVPFDRTGGHIIIPVTLNGVESRALLDSGATANGISERFLAQHEGEYKQGLQVIVAGVHGKRKVRLVDGIEVELFGVDVNLGQLLPLRLRGSDLIIGLPFFDNFILQIDYPGSRLRIMTRDALDLKEAANVEMRKPKMQAQPMVRVSLNDEYNTWLTLDTGNNTGILMPRKDALRFDWMEKYATEETLVSGVNRVATIDTFRLPEMTIGPFTLENVKVMVPTTGGSTTVGRDQRIKTGTRLSKASASGILGYDVLKHFVVTIDYKRSLLHLQPGQE